MRILGLDYGDKTIGVSISDPLQVNAFGLEVIFRDNPNSFKKSIRRLREIINEYNVTKIVLGFPKKMDNTLGRRCEITIAFKERLNRNFKNIEVVLYDERLTTVMSIRSLKGAMPKDKIDKVIDKIAAIHILQGYLDRENKLIDRENKLRDASNKTNLEV